MDEIINQQTPIIETPPIQEQQPTKKKPSIWIFLSILFFLTTITLSYLLLTQKTKEDKLVVKEDVEEKTTGIIKNEEIEVETIEASGVEENNKINENYSTFKNKDLNISFKYPTKWGEPDFWFSGEKYLMGIVFPHITEEWGIVLSATNPLTEPPGRGAFWGDYGSWYLKTENDLKKLCPEENELCKTYKNENNIMFVKKYETLGIEGGLDDFISCQYYIFNPTSIYSSIVISNNKFDKKIIPNSDKELEDLVNSISFIQ